MNSYSLPFKPTDRVLELGGGDNPLFSENADVRPGSKVTMVIDLNLPLPIANDTYDGVYSQFLLEHLRLVGVRMFIGEVFRILKPGGTAIIICANLLEQAQMVIEKEIKGEFNDDIVHMVFGGDPDYPENYHKASLTPQYAIRLFREAGFFEITIYGHPVAQKIWGRSTDMIIEAKKSYAQIQRSL